MSVQNVKRILLGTPIATAQAGHERLSAVTGLAVFASDALSSVAYATEEILLILVLAGPAALHLSLPIAGAIAVLIGIVVASYRQTILAYPQGGGSYVVTRENLGRYPSLVAGAALLVDYVLTVAVSVAAGIAALTSAVPPLYRHRVALCVAGVTIIAVGNLRGIREAGRLFALPTYLFLGAYGVLLGWGSLQWLRGEIGSAPAAGAAAGELAPLTIFLVLRAFASGCAALTGIEAVSDGVPAFRPPEAVNARRVLLALGLILITLFLGISGLAYAFGIAPVEGETVNSQLARLVFGLTVPYYAVQAVTMLILILAANTSFADFPRLASFLARDRFIPRQFTNRGDRLAFSNGIIILALLSIALLVLFQGDTHALIPLYALGVFVSFTLSQASMVRYWLRRRGPAWPWRATVNATGALATGLVAGIIGVTKFTHGAWIVAVLIPCMVALFVTIRRHYDDVALQLSVDSETPPPPPAGHAVLVLAGDVHLGMLPALEYARAISPGARGVYVEVDPEQTRRFEERWGKFSQGMPLVVLRSPFRSVTGPLIEYLDHLRRQAPRQLITIILPEFVPARWWQHLLHNQTALLIKAALLFHKGVVVTNVPYHLQR
jgi:amino acid transporter